MPPSTNRGGTRVRLGILAVVTALAVPTTGAVAPAAAVPAASVLVRTAEAQVGRYTPPAGIRFNNPLGDRTARRQIISHLIRSIDSTPRREKIRIASWNLRSNAIVDELIEAHRRGVSVRVIIDAGNANATNPNPGFDRLKTALSRRNAKRAGDMKSWARRCHGSCRGSSGIAHTKMFLFSKAGKARHVIMFGSANATDLAAGYQWNDLMTLRGRPAMWRKFERVFKEMARDRAMAEPYRVFGPRKRKAIVYPYTGPGTPGDPVLRELGRMRCAGATGGTGTNGKTRIRIGMTAMSDARGVAIAQRLRQMWNRGCDVRIVYAVMGNRVLKVLRDPSGRGAVPIRQIAQDWNLDGLYDRYLHMKVLTVSGVYRGNTAANVTWNGSANWTTNSLKSDEVGMKIIGSGIRRKYARWFDWLYFNPPPRPELTSTSTLSEPFNGRAAGTVVPEVEDPYALVEID